MAVDFFNTHAYVYLSNQHSNKFTSAVIHHVVASTLSMPPQPSQSILCPVSERHCSEIHPAETSSCGPIAALSKASAGTEGRPGFDFPSRHPLLPAHRRGRETHRGSATSASPRRLLVDTSRLRRACRHSRSSIVTSGKSAADRT